MGNDSAETGGKNFNQQLLLALGDFIEGDAMIIQVSASPFCLSVDKMLHDALRVCFGWEKNREQGPMGRLTTVEAQLHRLALHPR